jgi:hypothetical protein
VCDCVAQLMVDHYQHQRPMSARRRTSVTNLLDAIPEVNQPSSRTSGKEGEMVLPYDDISEVIVSSFDPIFQPKSIFKSILGQNSGGVANPGSMLGLPHQYPGRHPSMSRGGSTLNISNKPPRPRGLWLSTGMLPQFVVVTFYEKWLIKRVRFLFCLLMSKFTPHLQDVLMFAFVWLQIELQTRGVEEVSIHVNFSASTLFSPAKLLKMDKVTDE